MTRKVVKILGRSYAVEILESLGKQPKRFVDLKDVCKSNRTRTVRLKELKGEGLIAATPKMLGDRAYTFYEITPLGKRALELVRNFVQLNEKGRIP